MLKEPKKYNEKQIMEIFKKKSYPYKVTILTAALRQAMLDDPTNDSEVYYIAESMGYSFVEGFSEPKWIDR